MPGVTAQQAHGTEGREARETAKADYYLVFNGQRGMTRLDIPNNHEVYPLVFKSEGLGFEHTYIKTGNRVGLLVTPPCKLEGPKYLSAANDQELLGCLKAYLEGNVPKQEAKIDQLNPKEKKDRERWRCYAQPTPQFRQAFMQITNYCRERSGVELYHIPGLFLDAPASNGERPGDRVLVFVASNGKPTSINNNGRANISIYQDLGEGDFLSLSAKDIYDAMKKAVDASIAPRTANAEATELEKVKPPDYFLILKSQGGNIGLDIPSNDPVYPLARKSYLEMHFDYSCIRTNNEVGLLITPPVSLEKAKYLSAASDKELFASLRSYLEENVPEQKAAMARMTSEDPVTLEKREKWRYTPPTEEFQRAFQRISEYCRASYGVELHHIPGTFFGVRQKSGELPGDRKLVFIDLAHMPRTIINENGQSNINIYQNRGNNNERFERRTEDDIFRAMQEAVDTTMKREKVPRQEPASKKPNVTT